MGLCELADLQKHLQTGLFKVVGLQRGSDCIEFYCKDGTVIAMYHEQECCEIVSLESAESLDNKEDIYTDTTFCEIEEVSNIEPPCFDNYWDSFTWTFYKVKTNKGYDVLRWFGGSNGYYSERVDFEIRSENGK